MAGQQQQHQGKSTHKNERRNLETQKFISSASSDETLAFRSRKSPAVSVKGMAASSQSLATMIALDIMKAGGNCADAAVACCAALTVLEPASTSIGGDCFVLYFDAKKGKVMGLNGSGKSPQALTTDLLRERGVMRKRKEDEDEDQGDSDSYPDRIPIHDPLCITTPGAASGWVDTLIKFGSLKLSLFDILKPAIDLCEEGFPVALISSFQWKTCQQVLRDRSPNWAEMFNAKGEAPEHGEIMARPEYATVLRDIAQNGKDGFYKGRVAASIISAVKEQGGVLSEEDLSSHESVQVEPIHVTYNGYQLWECPPNSQGLVTLMALRIVEKTAKNLRGSSASISSLGGRDSVLYNHVLIESLRLAFEDCHFYICDPDFSKVPVDELLGDSYVSSRAELISESAAMKNVSPGSVVICGGDTIYLSVVDGEGNACSFINSAFTEFGSGIVPEGCGFNLQNRGHGFSLNEEHVNCVGPRKRPFHTIIPGMITTKRSKGKSTDKENSNEEQKYDLFSCFGVKGAFMQPQGKLQVFLNMVEFGMDPQEALDVPRVCVMEDGRICMEEYFEETLLEGLCALGHDVKRVDGAGRLLFGRGQAINERIYVSPDDKAKKNWELQREECADVDGRETRIGTNNENEYKVMHTLIGGSDPRGDGCAMGY
eukprot:Nk52_evm53s621 gene=Nk52_evmTU53s621